MIANVSNKALCDGDAFDADKGYSKACPLRFECGRYKFRHRHEVKTKYVDHAPYDFDNGTCSIQTPK